MEPQFKADQQKRSITIEVTAGKGSNDLEEVIQGAFGRVEQLLFRSACKNGDILESMELEMHNDAQPGDEDLLNAAAIQTIFMGNGIRRWTERSADDTPVAAVFRY